MKHVALVRYTNGKCRAYIVGAEDENAMMKKLLNRVDTRYISGFFRRY